MNENKHNCMLNSHTCYLALAMLKIKVTCKNVREKMVEKLKFGSQ